ncbi:MAG: transporter associated domain-containing protein [Bryobacteraceae bacterium]
MVTEWLGHLPHAGEVVEHGGIRIEVIAANDRRVEQVRVSRVGAPVAAEK